MKSAVLIFISFCLTLGTTTEIADETIVPEASHVKSIHIPYRSPVHVTGYAPATAILKSHSYTTKIRHEVPVAIAAAPAVVKSAYAVPAGHVKSSLLRHEVPVVVEPHKIITTENIPVVPVEIAPAPAVVLAEEPVKSIQAFSFASEVKHEVPVAPVAIAAPAAREHVKSIHAVAVNPQVLVDAPPPASVVVPVEVAAPAPAVVPVKSSAIKAFSFATEVKHEVPVAAVTRVAVPVAEAHAKSIHAPVVAPVAQAHVKSIHTPVVAPVAQAHVKSIHAPVVAPVAQAHVKSIHAPAVVRHVLSAARVVAPVAPVPAIAHVEGPVKSSAIESFSYGTKVRHGVAAVPVVQAPAVKSIHAPLRVSEALPHAPVVVPAAKSIHAPVLTDNHITAVEPLTAHGGVVRTAIAGPVAKSIHAPAVHSRLLAPAIKAPISHPYVTTVHRTSTFGAHAPALTAAGLLGARYAYPRHLVRRLPISAHINHRHYGGYYGHFPRLYASLAAPGAVLWGGHPVSSGVSYLGGISRGAFGYNPIPVHYQHYQSPVLGVWNYLRG